MHKDFYVSGFLYHVPTQQILLQQLPLDSVTSTPWSFFSGKNYKNETPEEAYMRLVEKQLEIKLSPKAVHLVYDYELDEEKLVQHILYGEVKTMKKNLSEKDDALFNWFTFKQVSKLPIHPQTKQDLIVAQRVINLVERNLLPPVEAKYPSR